VIALKIIKAAGQGIPGTYPTGNCPENLRRQVLRQDYTVLTEDRRSFDSVLEFADISRPGAAP